MKNDLTLLIEHSFPDVNGEGKMTFAGVLRKYYYEFDPLTGKEIGISRGWNDDTSRSYMSHYVDRIFPRLEKYKALQDYTADDFLNIVGSIQREHELAYATAAHYKRLLWIVYRAGFRHGLYEDRIQWDEDIDLYDEDPETRESLRAEILTKIKKSFTIEEEMNLLAYFASLDPRLATGEDVGQLIMYGFGYRNNETAGLNCDCIREIEISSHKSLQIVENYQSTKRGSNELKAGGKTPNSPRKLPGLDFVFDFLIRRRDYLYQLVADGKLILPAEFKDDMGKIPLVCRGHDYLNRCNSDDLSSAGRKLFLEVGVSKKQLAYLQQVLSGEEAVARILEEKDPTTYLYRRALATHLYALGFTMDEIQYYMAHDVETLNYIRSDFVNGDMLYKIKQKLDRHPACLCFARYKNRDVDILSDKMHEVCLKPGQEALITIRAEEPNDNIMLSMKTVNGSPMSGEIHCLPMKKEYTQTVDISEPVQNAYHRHME